MEMDGAESEDESSAPFHEPNMASFDLDVLVMEGLDVPFTDHEQVPFVVEVYQLEVRKSIQKLSLFLLGTAGKCGGLPPVVGAG